MQVRQLMETVQGEAVHQVVGQGCRRYAVKGRLLDGKVRLRRLEPGVPALVVVDASNCQDFHLEEQCERRNFATSRN